MQTMTLKVRSDPDGIIRLKIPTPLLDREIEMVLVMQPLAGELFGAMGYPPGYFEETYGSFAEDPLARSQPAEPDVRDVLE